ncbi:MAG: hypothetical protein NTW86_28665, partial [Candidatus Sumerlaeota bacterium]|nr:hypothetical protein [Candidatus Sumerlaeota bacterium]
MAGSAEKPRHALLAQLEAKGVVFPEGFDGVRVGLEANPDWIEPGAIIHRGCIVEGAGTILRAGS